MKGVRTAAAVSRALLATAFAGMGVLHFRPGPARTMAAMIPPPLRGRGALSPESMVRLSGACELAGAAGLLVPRTRVAAGAGLVLLLAAVFPANAYAAAHPHRFGAVALPLRPRLVAQLALAALTSLAALG
jgi:uncharacterized membrane protein